MTNLTVGQNKQFSTVAAAVAASRDGDVLSVDAGTYENDFATINTKITLQAVGGVARMVATEAPGNEKGIFVTNTDVTIDGFEFTGAQVPDGNGAGIRYQDGNLTVTNSYFHDNQNGLLGNPSPSGSVTIRNSEFSQNGAGDGYTHNLYVGEIGSLTISDSYFHDAVVGHQIKSRALSTTITNTRIADGEDGTGSYSIDLPNGGIAVLRDNVIEQGANSGNPVIIAYGVEGGVRDASSLEISGNTIINNMASPSVQLLWNATPVVANLTGNGVKGLSESQYGTGAMNITGMTLAGEDAGMGPAFPSPIIIPPTPETPPGLETAPGLETSPGLEGALPGVPLTITLGADSWEGDPFAIVMINGEVAFSGSIAAQRIAGGELVQLGSIDAGKLHQITVEFTNDAWGGSDATDRNLYVDGIQVDGVETGQSQVLVRNGTVSFTVDAAQKASPFAIAPAPPLGETFEAVQPIGTEEWDSFARFQDELEGSSGSAFDFGDAADVLAPVTDVPTDAFADLVFEADGGPGSIVGYDPLLTGSDLLFA